MTMATRIMTPAEQIAEARWWVAELSLDLPPGCTPALLVKARRRVAELICLHVRGALAPLTYEYDETVPF